MTSSAWFDHKVWYKNFWQMFKLTLSSNFFQFLGQFYWRHSDRYFMLLFIWVYISINCRHTSLSGCITLHVISLDRESLTYSNNPAWIITSHLFVRFLFHKTFLNWTEIQKQVIILWTQMLITDKMMRMRDRDKYQRPRTWQTWCL